MKSICTKYDTHRNKETFCCRTILPLPLSALEKDAVGFRKGRRAMGDVEDVERGEIKTREGERGRGAEGRIEREIRV